MLSGSAHGASPYITQVYEYRPAPGQFVNQLPPYASGDTESDMCAKALNAVGGTAGGTVSLGSFGGYIVFGFDHTVANVSGQPDFTVLGNSFFNDKALRPDGGNSEPGVIMVSMDANGNGLPDDPWYEIAGSEHDSPATIRDYSITYTRPAADHTPVVTDPKGAYDDEQYIPWTDNRGESGFIHHLIVQKQPYYPEWVDAQSLTFTGTRLPDNAEIEGSRIKEYVLYSFGYGYADNVPNDDSRASIDIGWAVDADGRPANLPGIDFVKVYTGLRQDCQWLGETSTEVCGAVDLHPDAAGTAGITDGAETRIFYTSGHIHALGLPEGARIRVYSSSGILVMDTHVGANVWTQPWRPQPGVYIAVCGRHVSRMAVSG